MLIFENEVLRKFGPQNENDKITHFKTSGRPILLGRLNQLR